ncbi:MAG TPA: carboxypeptidase regulatory-like domain-containing protein [Thermoplasmata archaeon]|nr:carboxypeptidase regulatory-like domain-containing protein [Thermoplasmata archaeon]
MRASSSSLRTVSSYVSVTAALLVAVLVIPAGLVAASGPDGTLQGYVTDHASGTAIPGALVQIRATDLPWTFQATTTATGYYAIALPNHRYTVTVSAPAYSANATSAGVGSGLTTWFNVSLTAASPRSAHIQGYVTDGATNAGITVGRVVMSTAYFYYGSPYTNSSGLNATGYYRIDLVPATYVLSTDGVTGYVPYSHSYLYPNAGSSIWYNFTMTTMTLSYWINGTVEDSTNYTPIPGATVTASVNGQQFASTVSNATGRYSLHTPLGTIALVGDALAYAPYSATAYATFPGQTALNLYLIPLTSRIRGSVMNGLTGAGIGNALVVVSPFWSSGYYDQARTSAAGAYAVPVPVDDYYVAASAPGFTSWTAYAFFFVTGVQWVNITLWPIVAPVKGYVLDGGTGLPLGNEYVYATDVRSGYSAGATSDATGLYSFVLPPSPAVSLRVYGAAPYVGAMLYVTTTAYATTWANITLERLNAQIVANVTDATTGLPIAGAAVSMYWTIGSSFATASASGIATVPVPAGLSLTGYAWATGYQTWSGAVPAVSTSLSLSIALYPSLNTNVTVKGYVRNSLTSGGVSAALVRTMGYGPAYLYGYTNSTGYYSFAVMPAPQTLRATAYGYTAATAAVNPSAGSTIWVNLTITPDATPPQISNFTATPAVNVGLGNPTAPSADINETSPDHVHLSVLLQMATSRGNGTFLDLGMLPDSSVSTTATGPHTQVVRSTWDTRMQVARLSDGTSSTWWTAAPWGAYEILVSGTWTNASLTIPTYAAALFDIRSGSLLYVSTGYGVFGPQDQPTSTFTPAATGLLVNLTSQTVLGSVPVSAPGFRVGSLSASVGTAVPGGSYAALLEAWDAGSNYGRAVTLFQVAADTIPPVARAGPDQTVNQGATVTFNGAGSTDDTGITSYTWTFVDGSPRVLHGATPSYLFRNAGRFTVTLTVTDTGGNTGSATMTVTVRDTTPPTVAFVLPAAKANVSGTITLEATASDNVGVVRVEFLVDGVPVANVTSAPFTFPLNTAGVTNGAHTLTAVAFDAAGNSATATERVTVSNAGSGGFAGMDTTTLFLLLLLVVVFAAVAAVLLIVRGRRRRVRYLPPPPNPPMK